MIEYKTFNFQFQQMKNQNIPKLLVPNNYLK